MGTPLPPQPPNPKPQTLNPYPPFLMRFFQEGDTSTPNDWAELRAKRVSSSDWLGSLHRSSSVSPVCLAIRVSIRGPISSLSWNAKVKSGQPERDRTRCDVPDWRLIVQPIRNKAASTNRALVDGHWLMLVQRRRRGVPEFPPRVRADRPARARPKLWLWKPLPLDSVRIP